MANVNLANSLSDQWRSSCLADHLLKETGFEGVEDTIPASTDKEKYYHQHLTEAFKQNKILEQVLYVEKCAELCLQRNDYKRSAGFYNSALVLSEKHRLPKEHLNYLFRQLERIESVFLKNNHTKTGPKFSVSNYYQDYRKRIKKIRELSTQQVIKGFTIAFVNSTTTQERKIFQAEEKAHEILAKMTEQFSKLLGDLFEDCIKVLGTPPTKYTCIGMGSMARKEMCPYSDVEFAILIKKVDDKALNYFRLLSQLMEIKVMNMGETVFGFLRGVDSLTHGGFCLDTAGNTPLGIPELYELIGTPKQLASFQSPLWENRNIILVNALGQVNFVTGNTKLFTQYQQALMKQRESYGRILGINLMKGNVREFEPDLSEKKEQERAFGVKKELYRPFQSILGSLQILYGLQTHSTMETIQALKRELFSESGATNLMNTMEKVLRLRLQVHLFYENETEILYHPKAAEQSKERLMTITPVIMGELTEIYKILIPFVDVAKEFCKTGDLKIFKNQSFNQEDLYERRRDDFIKKNPLLAFLNPLPTPEDELEQKVRGTPTNPQVQAKVQQLVSLNPTNPSNLLMKAQTEKDPRVKMQYAKEAVDLIIHQDGDGPFVEKLSEKSVTVRDNKMLPPALMVYGEACMECQEYQQAYKAFKKAVVLVQQQYMEVEPPLGMMLPLLVNLIAAAKRANNPSKSELYFNRLIKMTASYGVSDALDIAVLLVGVQNLNISDVLMAERYLIDNQDLFLTNCSMQEKLVLTWDNLGGAAKKCGMIDQSIQYLLNAYHLFIKLDTNGQYQPQKKIYNIMFELLFDVMEMYDQQKKIPVMFNHYTLARELLDINQPKRFSVQQLAQAYNKLGLFWQSRNSLISAECFERVLEVISEKKNDPTQNELSISVYNNLGLAYKRSERYDLAAQSYRQAIALYQGNPVAKITSDFIVIMINLGSVLKALDRDAEAKQTLLQALEMAKEINENQLIQHIKQFLVQHPSKQIANQQEFQNLQQGNNQIGEKMPLVTSNEKNEELCCCILL